ncbi:hypothetical protein O181_024645 [Austropuccinia psidii MF-1]|uniref:Uncharacterized protein n=1 Tax=Austropuccinia psidii MF-1 TaxID=1389203 RepID=A0A9Q3H0B4_9BASI|nr:hypothetical protein [Austropuccinia psidii MF-1]
MGDAIREQSDEEQDPRAKFLVEYQEEKPLEVQDTSNKNLCKHTQGAQTFLVTPTKGMSYIHGTATKMTVFIDNPQHPVIIDSGTHCSIVARNIFWITTAQIGKNSSCQQRQRTSKVHQGR